MLRSHNTNTNSFRPIKNNIDIIIIMNKEWCYKSVMLTQRHNNIELKIFFNLIVTIVAITSLVQLH